MIRLCLVLCLSVLLSACASKPPQLPFPAFVQVDGLENIFMAGLPGARGKQLAGDPQTRRTSNRVDLPGGWQGTSGAAPGRSTEIFVVAGRLRIADIELPAGGYAFLPSGSLGFNLQTDGGARILYFVNDIDPESVIRSPIIIDSGLLGWDATVTPGVTTRELRKDPGSGATTWLMRITRGTTLPWEKSSAVREGYMLQGDYRHSECVGGEVHTGQYAPGGYFYRPADTINGGPASMAMSDTIWFVRETAHGTHEIVSACMPIS